MKITATDVLADVMNALVFYSTDGVIFTAGLPDDGTIADSLVFTGDSDQVGEGAWTISGIADLAPGTYIIRVTVSDKDGGSTDVDVTINVEQEEAGITYNGPEFVSTTSIRESVAIVELRAIIQDVTAVDPVLDPDSGNITTANVTFVNLNDGSTIAVNIPVVLLDADPAIFITKANLFDITDPENPISIGGNLTLLISETDSEDSQIPDSIGITLWYDNELWFSSNWTGTETIEQYLTGGNLVIRS